MTLRGFSCASWPSACLLFRNDYLGLLPIFDWVVCFFNIELHELFIYFLDYNLMDNPLSVDSFANIFSHSEGCFFILFIVSFAV